MSFKSHTYQVMIASPSDLDEERKAVTDAIYEWNTLHSTREAIVLLPVKWETHATPQTNTRAQAAINENLVKNSDVLIGLFWTRLGTNTGLAPSGTIEEIQQFVNAKKPALLYFSNKPISPEKIDSKQHRALKKFKREISKNALVGNFSDTNELRAKILLALSHEVSKLKVSQDTLLSQISEPITAEAVEEIFDPDNQANFEDRVYAKLSAEAAEAEYSLIGVTTAALGEDFSIDSNGNQISPSAFWDRQKRLDYLLSLRTTIIKGMMSEKGFRYERIYQRSPNAPPPITDINANAKGHVESIREAVKPIAGSPLTLKSSIKFSVLKTSRTTGFLIIDGKTLLLLVGGIDKHHKAYMSGVFVFRLNPSHEIIKSFEERFEALQQEAYQSGTVLFQYPLP